MADSCYRVLRSEEEDGAVSVHSEWPTLLAALTTAHVLGTGFAPAPEVYVIGDEGVVFYPIFEQDPEDLLPPDVRWENCLVRGDPDDPNGLDTSSCSENEPWTTSDLVDAWPLGDEAASTCDCAWCGEPSTRLVPLMRDEHGFIYQCRACYGWTDSSPDPIRPYRSSRESGLAGGFKV